MKRTLWTGLAIALAFTLLTGCQATPEQPVVVQKDMAQMIEKGMAQTETPAPAVSTGIGYAGLCAHYGVPERFQYAVTEGNLTINCDVAFQLPETLGLPMVRVAAGRFSQQRVTALFRALCDDTPMYVAPELMDKAYYEKEILQYQAELAQTTGEDSIRWYNDVIDSLKEQHEKAPDTLTLVPCDGTLKTREFKAEDTDGLEGSQQELFATADPNNMENAMTIYFINDADYTKTSVYSYEDEYGNTQMVAPRSGSHMEFSRVRDEVWWAYEQDGTLLEDVTALSLSDGKAQSTLLKTAPRQARETVERLLTEAGIDDMVIDSIGLYTNQRAMPDYYVELMEQQGREVTQPSEAHAYIFRLLRVVNGAAVESCESSSETSTDGMAFGKEWYYEELKVTVDDGGIANVYWMAPLQVTEVMTADAALLPFSDIANIFEKMTVIGSDIYTSPERRERLDITRARLCLQRIMERDSFTTGLLVPVWNFYGTVTYWDGEGEAHTNEYANTPLLSVNAIDGSVIDPQQGY
jgi:hypothetical protein